MAEISVALASTLLPLQGFCINAASDRQRNGRAIVDRDGHSQPLSGHERMGRKQADVKRRRPGRWDVEAIVPARRGAGRDRGGGRQHGDRRAGAAQTGDGAPACPGGRIRPAGEVAGIDGDDAAALDEIAGAGAGRPSERTGFRGRRRADVVGRRRRTGRRGVRLEAPPTPTRHAVSRHDVPPFATGDLVVVASGERCNAFLGTADGGEVASGGRSRTAPARASSARK